MNHLRALLPPWLIDWLDVVLPLAQVAGIVLLAWVLQRLVRRVLTRLSRRYQLPPAAITPARNLLRWLIYGIAGLWVLERLGVSSEVLWAGITSFVAVGAVAFFEAWSVLSNLFCAVLIFTTRPFREGDTIELIDSGDKSGIKGRVVDIRLIYTVLEDRAPAHAGALLQVPNTLFFQKSLRRWRAGVEPAPSQSAPTWEI